MNSDLARRRPANAQAAVVRQVVDLAAPTKREVLAALQRQQRAGMVERSGPLRLVTEGPYAGQYAVRVTRLPARPAAAPRWATVSLRAGWVLFGLSALALSVRWLLVSLTPAALVTCCLTVLAVFGAWVWIKYGRRGSRTTEVSVNVTVHNR